MPSTNGHGTKRAVLYARVSTDEQARSGYSLAQQLEALRAYAAREGYEVLEGVTDPGQSGASLERPGMDRVRDLVAAGGVAVVLAQDADRLTRDPIHRAFLDEEMERFGTRLMALDDWGDDSHEGELLRYMKGWVSKGERLKTAERTRRGKLSKARQGKIVANHRPHYGFRYNATKDNYVVDEDEMRVVRRIFYMVGVEGRSLRAVRRTLEAERLSTPGGAKYWSQMFVRSVILDDVYLPHTYGEMKELVAPEVAARLDPRPALRHLLAQHQVQHLQTGEGKRVGWENLPQEAEDRAEAQRRVDSRACAGLRDTEGVGRRGSGIHQR